MDDSEKPSLPPSLRDLIEQERRRLGPHPPVEDLIAYQAGDLPAEQEERLRDHLALCHECARLLLDLRDFPDISLPEGAPRPTPAEVEAAWEALQPRLKEPRPVAAPALHPVEAPKELAPAPVQPLRRPISPWLPATLAAVFFLSTVGLSVWVISLQRELKRPQSAEVIRFETVRALGQGEVLSAPKRNVLEIPFEEDEAYTRYALAIQEVQTQKEVLRTSAPRGSSGDFTLVLPPDTLAPGRYRLTIYGLRDGQQPEPVQRFPFQVHPR